jgi:hypothetical protein
MRQKQERGWRSCHIFTANVIYITTESSEESGRRGGEVWRRKEAKRFEKEYVVAAKPEYIYI